jgi:peptidoglycan/xylan/chitin deacetylase (PgdA/CDA1 family)
VAALLLGGWPAHISAVFGSQTTDAYNDAQQSSASLPLTRSAVCPVLYTHQVASATLLGRVLDGLLSAGYRPTTLASVDAAMQGQADLPPGCLVLTFDDALYSQFSVGLPVLERYHVPAVFFVMPAFGDGVHRYMTADELRGVHDAGHEVEAHTCNHPNLVRLARLSDVLLMAELVDCKRTIETIVGSHVDYFAYPYGATSPEVLNGVTLAGYRAAFTTRSSALLSAPNPFLMPRIHYEVGESPATILRRIRAAGG